MTITNKQITQLLVEAAAAGDIMQAAICAKALNPSYDDAVLDSQDAERLDRMSQAECIAECERVMREAGETTVMEMDALNMQRARKAYRKSGRSISFRAWARAHAVWFRTMYQQPVGKLARIVAGGVS